MSLNKVKKGSQMYDFIDATWNTVKGACYHDCSYCYMKGWGKLNPIRFDEKELKTDLGKGKFIFVGSSCDMWAVEISKDWIIRTLEHCIKYPDNKYLFQSKNPDAFFRYGVWHTGLDLVLCTTIESNKVYGSIMNKSPHPFDRAVAMGKLSDVGVKTYVTIEPIMDFDLKYLTDAIRLCNPEQVNIGADSKGHKLPEPPKEKILELISELEKFTIVKQKSNLKRLLK